MPLRSIPSAAPSEATLGAFSNSRLEYGGRDTLFAAVNGGDHPGQTTIARILRQSAQARPIATMTVEAQERHERNERISRDD